MKKIATLLLITALLLPTVAFGGANIPEEVDLKEYLGFEYDLFPQSKVDEGETLLDDYLEVEGVDAEAEEAALEALNTFLKANGITVPMTSFTDVIERYPNRFSDRQKKEIVGLEKALVRESDEGGSELRVMNLYQKLAVYLETAGFNVDDLLGHMSMNSVLYAKYEHKAGKATLIEALGTYRPQDFEKFQYVVDRTLELTPKVLAPYIDYFLVNSDGVYNTAAFVRQETDKPEKWRVVLDIKDAYDKEGAYRSAFDETIVHELAHIMTLNLDQMQETASGTYETNEGITAPTSYLNSFYQKFWTPISAQHAKMVSWEQPDSVYDFYDKFSNQFVSEYAATNPEEDIAETIRVFVFNDKPEGNTIADQKVKWLYSQKDMTKIRDVLREKLGLSK